MSQQSLAASPPLVLSRYVVASDPFTERDGQAVHRLVLSTRSGKMFKMRVSLWQALVERQFDKMSPAMLRRLMGARLLVQEGTDELTQVLAENDAEIAQSRQLYQVIQPSAFCQLGCGYCGQKHEKKQLDIDNRDRIIARVADKLAARPYDRLHIGWFGAEPLAGMASIRALSPRLREEAARYGAVYTAHVVTNGVKLDVATALELSREHGVVSAEVTLDGPADVHDARRHFKAGGPSFDRILTNLVDVAHHPEIPLSLTIRCNVDARNAPAVEALIDVLADAGLAGRANLYFAPIHDWGNSASELSLDMPTYARHELEWTVYAMSRGFSFGLLPSRKKIVCMAVQPDSEVIDAYGNVFNCTETPYVEAYGTANRHRIATLQSEGVDRTVNRFGDFNADVADGKYGCGKCPMLPVCGGACPKSWAEGQAACPSFKFSMPDRLLVAHALRQLVEPVETLEVKSIREGA